MLVMLGPSDFFEALSLHFLRRGFQAGHDLLSHRGGRFKGSYQDGAATAHLLSKAVLYFLTSLFV